MDQAGASGAGEVKVMRITLVRIGSNEITVFGPVPTPCEIGLLQPVPSIDACTLYPRGKPAAAPAPPGGDSISISQSVTGSGNSIWNQVPVTCRIPALHAVALSAPRIALVAEPELWLAVTFQAG